MSEHHRRATVGSTNDVCRKYGVWKQDCSSQQSPRLFALNHEQKKSASCEKETLKVPAGIHYSSSLKHRPDCPSAQMMIPKRTTSYHHQRPISKAIRRSFEKRPDNDKEAVRADFERISVLKNDNQNQLEHYYDFSSPLVASDDDGPRFVDHRASVYQNRDCISLPMRKDCSLDQEYRNCCLYCRCWYDTKNNPRGSCSEAPDPVEKLISKVTCYPLAQGAVYHCCRDDDEVPAKIGQYGYGYNVCGCGPNNTSTKKQIKRWLLLLLLAMFAPCLCCYLPARATYRCCRPKGGRHKPSGNFQMVDSTASLHRRKSTVF